jgi:hypothetical protein
MNNTVSTEIENIVNKHNHQLLSVISKRYNIPYDDLMKIVTNTTTSDTSCAEVKSQTHGNDIITTNTSTEAVAPACPPGKIFNNSTGRYVSINGSVGKKIIKQQLLDQQQEIEQANVDRSDPIIPKPLLLRKNKVINKLCHPGTNMVFDSSENRVVIGKLTDNTIARLTEDDIATCENMGFQYEIQDVCDEEEQVVGDVDVKQPPDHPGVKSDVDVKQPPDHPENSAYVTPPCAYDIESVLNNLQGMSIQEEY